MIAGNQNYHINKLPVIPCDFALETLTGLFVGSMTLTGIKIKKHNETFHFWFKSKKNSTQHSISMEIHD